MREKQLLLAPVTGEDVAAQALHELDCAGVAQKDLSGKTSETAVP